MSMFELCALIESNQKVTADFIASLKDDSQDESINSDDTTIASLLSLIESNKEAMKDFIALQIQIRQSFITTRGVKPPRLFKDLEQIKAIILSFPEFPQRDVDSDKTQHRLKKPLKILLAEDDMLLRKSLSFYLSHNGFDMVQVTNGLEAMEEISKTTFDVLVLDLQMPYMGGLEIIDRVRNHLKLETKIIVLTASGVEEVELKSFSIGATDFMAKPFSPTVLKARIEKMTTNYVD